MKPIFTLLTLQLLIHCIGINIIHAQNPQPNKNPKPVFPFTGIIDTSMVNTDSIDTARDANYLNEKEKRMVYETNFVRVYPQVYAKIVAQTMHEQSLSLIGISQDKYDATIELIKELKRTKPMKPLYPMECIYNAAKKHGQYCFKTHHIDHEGENKSRCYQRIMAECGEFWLYSENLVGLSVGGAKEAFILLLLDVGLPHRGHRKNILNPSHRYIGCYQYKDVSESNLPYDYYIQDFAGEPQKEY